MHLLNTFFKGIALAYQMSLDTTSEGNFNTRNPEEAVRLIENLASRNSTKNTDFERRKLVTVFGKEQMNDVKAKLGSVHKLLKKQVSFAEDVEAVDVGDEDGDEKNVNFNSGTSLQNQRYGNQSGNKNSYGNNERRNYNQSSQY